MVEGLFMYTSNGIRFSLFEENTASAAAANFLKIHKMYHAMSTESGLYVRMQNSSRIYLEVLILSLLSTVRSRFQEMITLNA